MKITFVSNTSFSMWNFRRHILKSLLDDGHQITCLVGADATCQNLKNMGVHVIELPISRSGINPFTELKLIWTIYQFIKKIGSDIVISYTIKPNSYVPLVAKILCVPSLAVLFAFGAGGSACRAGLFGQRVGGDL